MIREDVLIGIAVSVVGTGAVGFLGWLFRTQLGKLAYALGDIPNRIYGWGLTFILVGSWIAFKIANIPVGTGFTILVIMTVFMVLVSSINSRD